MNKSFRVKQINIAKILLLAILVLGAWLRFTNLSAAIWSNVGYDETRDTIVASHIVEYHESLSRGPHASNQYLSYPPTYYYFISLLWSACGSIYGSKILWAILSLSVIIAGYKVGKILLDDSLGLIVASLLAVHPIFVIMGQQITPPYLLPPLVLLMTALLMVKPISASHLNAVAILFFLCFHIHYSIFIVAPVIGVWWLSAYIKYWQNSNTRMRILPIIVGALGFMSWIFSSYQEIPFDQLKVLTHNAIPFIDMLNQSSKAIMKAVYLVFYQDNVDLRWFVVLLLGMFCIVGYAVFIHVQLKINRKIFVYIVALTSLPFLVAGRFIGEMSTGYVTVVLPYLVLIISIFLRMVIERSKIFGLILLACLTIFYSQKSKEELHGSQPYFYYNSMLTVAKSIANDYRSISNNKIDLDLTLRYLSPDQQRPLDDWQTGGIWFHLEHIFNMRLIYLYDIDTNFQPINKKPKYVYIICDKRIFERFSLGNISCEAAVDTLGTKFQEAPVRIYVEEPFVVWRMSSKVILQ